MTTLDFIRRIEQQQKEQDHIYHNTAVRYGLSDTDMWILYSVYTAPGTRNQKKILLTDKGTELAGNTVGHLIKAEERAYAALTPEELQAYLDMTVRLTAALREETEEL